MYRMSVAVADTEQDFTFVCPTEILAFNQAISKFEALGVQLLMCSTDSEVR